MGVVEDGCGGISGILSALIHPDFPTMQSRGKTDSTGRLVEVAGLKASLVLRLRRHNSTFSAPFFMQMPREIPLPASVGASRANHPAPLSATASCPKSLDASLNEKRRVGRVIDFGEGETANFSSEFLQRGVITIRAFQNQRLTGDGLTCPLARWRRERERGGGGGGRRTGHPPELKVTLDSSFTSNLPAGRLG